MMFCVKCSSDEKLCKKKAPTRQDKTLFTLGPLLNGVGGIYTKYLSKTRDKMVEKHTTKYLKIQINI